MFYLTIIFMIILCSENYYPYLLDEEMEDQKGYLPSITKVESG